jgi:hypothetical protein
VILLSNIQFSYCWIASVVLWLACSHRVCPVMCWRSALDWTNTLSWICIVLAHWNNSPCVDMSLHSDTLFWFRANLFLIFLQQLFWFPETSSSSEKQATGPGLWTDSPYSISWKVYIPIPRSCRNVFVSAEKIINDYLQQYLNKTGKTVVKSAPNSMK